MMLVPRMPPSGSTAIEVPRPQASAGMVTLHPGSVSSGPDRTIVWRPTRLESAIPISEPRASITPTESIQYEQGAWTLNPPAVVIDGEGHTPLIVEGLDMDLVGAGSPGNTEQIMQNGIECIGWLAGPSGPGWAVCWADRGEKWHGNLRACSKLLAATLPCPLPFIVLRIDGDGRPRCARSISPGCHGGRETRATTQTPSPCRARLCRGHRHSRDDVHLCSCCA